MDMKLEFKRLHSVGVKFIYSPFRPLAIHIIKNSANPPYTLSKVHTGTKHSIEENGKRDHKLGSVFCERFQIMQRACGGKLTISPAKQEFTVRKVLYHLNVLCSQFNIGELDEEYLKNADNVHFIVKMATEKELCFKDEQKIK